MSNINSTNYQLRGQQRLVKALEPFGSLWKDWISRPNSGFSKIQVGAIIWFYEHGTHTKYAAHVNTTSARIANRYSAALRRLELATEVQRFKRWEVYTALVADDVLLPDADFKSYISPVMHLKVPATLFGHMLRFLASDDAIDSTDAKAMFKGVERVASDNAKASAWRKAMPYVHVYLE